MWRVPASQAGPFVKRAWKKNMNNKNLVIHDLDPAEWDRISGDYDGWNIVTDNGSIHPCIGCFSCWNRTPGICAVHDG